MRVGRLNISRNSPTPLFEKKRGPDGQHPIIFFDGVCNLCNHFIRWVTVHDRTGIYHFASLQGETAKRILGPQAIDPMTWSIVLVEEGNTFRKSEAVLKILRGLGGMGKLMASGLSWIPSGFSDHVYDFIAKNRYRWFGKKESCLPTKSKTIE